MNKLESIILDQYERVKAAGAEPETALEQSQGEIMEVATPELALEIIADYERTHIPQENRSTRAIMRAQQDPGSVMNRSVNAIRNGNLLAEMDMLSPEQGYTGGLLIGRGEPIVFGYSASFNHIYSEDPIQEAMGDTFYPPMMWVKALRAEAYKNRPESAQDLTISEYLARLGFHLGSIATLYGDIVGATGFMPGARLLGNWGNRAIKDHVTSEPIEAFRLSGLCDQAVLDPDILLDTPKFAKKVIEAGGNLN